MNTTMSALDVTLRLIGPGAGIPGTSGLQPVGSDLVPLDNVGLVIASGTDTVTVVGTPQQLRGLVLDGLSLDIPEGVPLVDQP